MASTILAAGTTAATSTPDTDVATGATLTVGIDSAAAIGVNDYVMIFKVGTLSERPLLQLNSSNPATVLAPGKYRFKRPVTTASIAVYSE